MMKAIVVDDEKNNVEVLQTLLNTYCPEVTVVGVAHSVQEAYTKINELRPDLVFLDIQMPLQNGFELLRMFTPHIPFEVIFVTGYDHYAITAIKFSALDYLLKPVEIEELKWAVEKAKNTLARKYNSSLEQQQLIENLHAQELDKTIVIHDKEKVSLVKISEIEYIQSEGRYSDVFLQNGQHYLMARTLKEFEEFFQGNEAFLRINKSVIIYLPTLKSYTKGETCIIELASGNSFEVSRRRKQEILQRLKK